MSLSSKFLSPEDLSNRLDVTGQSSLRFNNSKAGLQSDMPEDISESAEKLKLEIEVDLSEIKNVSAEIEIELKLANTVNASIEADKEALAKEAINRDVIDYSINSFNNQMLAEQRGDMLVSSPEVSGMQGVASMTIADGLRYVVENKKELFQKALEKLQKLFAYLIKKIKEYYRKGFYALHRFIHMPNRLAERLNNLPDGVLNLLITPNMLSDKTKNSIEGAFSIFSFLNVDDSKRENTFSLVDKLDRLRLEQVFSNKMFLDIEYAAKDGILKTRDVELLNVLSNKEIIKKYFAYTVPTGFSIDKDVIFAIAFNTNASTGKISNVTLGISKTNFYTEDSLDLSQSTTVTFDATLRPSLSADVVITLGSISDLSAIGKILSTFDSSSVKSIEDSQNRGLNMLEKKVNSLNVADKDMQIKFKTYKGIYDVLNVVAMSNLIGLINCYARVSKSLENVVDEVIAHEKAREAAGVQSDFKSKAGLQFFGFGKDYESNLTYTRVSDYLKGNSHVDASWEGIAREVWTDEDFEEANDGLAAMEDNFKRGSVKKETFKKVSPDRFIVDPKKYANYVEDITDTYEMNKEDIEDVYKDEPALKKKALKFNEDMFKFLTKVHTLLNKNIRPMEA